MTRARSKGAINALEWVLTLNWDDRTSPALPHDCSPPFLAILATPFTTRRSHDQIDGIRDPASFPRRRR